MLDTGLRLRDRSLRVQCYREWAEERSPGRCYVIGDTEPGLKNMTTDRIEINPLVMMGKPGIKGIELILRNLSEGSSEDDLLDAYPRLTLEDIRAAIRYGADTVAHEEIILLPSPETSLEA